MSESTKAAELLPCPFEKRSRTCGLIYAAGGDYVRCERHTEWLPVSDWQTRAPHPAPQTEPFQKGGDASCPRDESETADACDATSFASSSASATLSASNPAGQPSDPTGQADEQPDAVAAEGRCIHCRHAFHIGPCLNMASDGECSCVQPADLAKARVVEKDQPSEPARTCIYCEGHAWVTGRNGTVPCLRCHGTGLSPNTNAKPTEPATYTAEELKQWFPAKCPKCGWRGLSRDCAGGEPIADTGDYSDAACPVCVKRGEGEWIPIEDDREHPQSDALNGSPGFVAPATVGEAVDISALAEQVFAYAHERGATAGYLEGALKDAIDAALAAERDASSRRETEAEERTSKAMAKVAFVEQALADASKREAGLREEVKRLCSQLRIEQEAHVPLANKLSTANARVEELEAELENCRQMGMRRYQQEMQPGFHWVNERADKAEKRVAELEREWKAADLRADTLHMQSNRFEQERDDLRQKLAEAEKLQAASDQEIELLARDYGQASDALDRAKEDLASTRAQLEEARREASQLATYVWQHHYKDEAPEWGLCDTVAGIISQLDNMYAGLREKLAAVTRERDEALFDRDRAREARDANARMSNTILRERNELRAQVASLQGERDALKKFADATFERVNFCCEEPSEIDPYDIADDAVKAGLMRMVPYDPEHHGFIPDAEPGKDIYERVTASEGGAK